MRLIYCYARGDTTTSPQHFQADGHYLLFTELLSRGIFDAVEVVVDGSPDRVVPWSDRFCYRSVPDINSLEINSGDIVWVRAGFKPTTFYERLQGKNWLIFYGANTGRERWPFWNVVLDDLSGQSRIDQNGRLWFDYAKPVNETVFKYQWLPKEFDACLGASFIHDKKGQWLGLLAAHAYQKKVGQNLKIVMPGTIRHSEKTNVLPRIIKELGLDVCQPGMVDRIQLAEIFNRSKIFIHLGSGQNDRSLLEAMSCGLPCVVGQPKYHPAWCSEYPFSVCSPPDPERLALSIEEELFRAPRLGYRIFLDQFQRKNGLHYQVLPRMERLFRALTDHPVPDRAVLEVLNNV